MKLIHVLKGVALAGILAAGGSVAFAQEVTLKWADQFPLTHTSSRIAAQPFITEIEERSNGRIKIQHFPAEQLAKGAGLLDAVRNRVADMALIIPNYNSDKLPLTSAGELPGLFTESVAATEGFNAYITQDLLEREYLPLRVRPLWGTVTPPYQIMFREGHTVRNVSALRGEKLRVPGSTGELIAKALGGVPVKVPASDLYLALQRGTVDGALYNAPSIIAYKIEDVTSSISRNGSFGAVTTALIINDDVWEDLSGEDRALIQEVADDIRKAYAEGYEAETQEAYQKMEAAGVEVVSLPDDALAAVSDKLESVRDAWVGQLSARGLPAQEMLDAYVTRLAE
ncbi:TRAP transporter substrate-binding protein DctP [Paracoccus sp. SCSIO 75233]|uniref:TRAP transporter substrate-binding protein n=1 Tax=Paracoccus sp. SCSIO 75233 TaxID=3017782 RepID=UPI0022F04497|nr:TRAP transporter substrate-binding protein DctP [Paracoccus sp. SCSIO 75233]WBU52431.1 TRAP transporter substrate-binding protein DctP [Paracoccus sp. SCSIO 75233]